MKTLTTHERISRMYEHKEADRIPVWDYPWPTTIERWRQEGMPSGVDYIDYLDLDRMVLLRVDNSPRYPVEIVEQTDAYTICTTEWGVTLKDWTHITSTPQFLDFTIKDPDSWQAAKARMTPTTDRIPWEHLKRNYAGWRKEGAWIEACLWFGFDVTHSWAVGTENLLIALVEHPEWCLDMFNHFLDINIALLEQVWDAGYTFDSVMWYDDMGYKNRQFFSMRTYRKLLKPVHQRAIDWAHAKGIRARLHSCGDINPFVPELIGMGLDGLNPLEVKAGMDPIHLKQTYGDDVLLHGGINAVLWDDREAIEAEMRRVTPVLKQNGGYIFSSDHSVPSSVSLENFRHIVNLAKALGSYD
ncbi:MAG: hypothetical protein JXB35_11365 [Anaerolineae bacterium]|nr:hypothetical protein [Anaerolineae bacterium]